MAPVVDVHSHLYLRSYIDLLKARERPPQIVEHADAERFVAFAAETKADTPGRPIDSSYWSVDAKLHYLDREGIDQAVISLGNPWLDPIEDDSAVAVARALNEEFAALEGATGGRLVGLGVLPQRDPETAAQVAEEIGASGTLYGVANGCLLCRRPLDDSDLDPVWAVLERTRLPFVVHPHYGIGGDVLGEPGYALALAFPFETTLALVRLLLGGVLERFPGLRIVAVHGGGALPYLAGRVDAFWETGALGNRKSRNPPSAGLAKLALDAVLYGPGPLRNAVDLVGASRVMFGTDHPFAVADAPGGMAAIDQVLDGEARSLVRGGAAVAYFGLPAVTAGSAAA